VTLLKKIIGGRSSESDHQLDDQGSNFETWNVASYRRSHHERDGIMSVTASRRAVTPEHTGDLWINEEAQQQQ